MNTLKNIFSLCMILVIFSSCTEEALEDENLNSVIENQQATNDDDKVDDGSKD